MDQINDLRTKIDKIDDEIMNLLDKRFSIAIHIGNLKELAKTSVLDTKRENIVLDKTSNYSHSPEIGVVYNTIMEQSKSLQRK